MLSLACFVLTILFLGDITLSGVLERLLKLRGEGFDTISCTTSISGVRERLLKLRRVGEEDDEDLVGDSEMASSFGDSDTALSTRSGVRDLLLSRLGMLSVVFSG